MSSTDPSVHCDCRAKSIRNVRVISILVGAVALILSLAVFEGGSDAAAVCRLLAGLSLVSYGIWTILDDTATFPRPLYAAIAVSGAVVALLVVSGIL